jgi:hypothetical protein
MQCPRCQHDNPPGMKFCGECAAPLAASCPSSGAANPPGNKFCGQCATPLQITPKAKFAAPESYTPKHLAEKILTSKAALEGERKQVTVLFADLKGSMELLADRDPEEARKLLDPVLERMMERARTWRWPRSGRSTCRWPRSGWRRSGSRSSRASARRRTSSRTRRSRASRAVRTTRRSGSYLVSGVSPLRASTTRPSGEAAPVTDGSWSFRARGHVSFA